MVILVNDPKRDHKGQYRKKYPFNLLDLGESCYIKIAPKESPTYAQQYHALRSAAYLYGKRHKCKITCKHCTGGRIKLMRVR